MCLLSLPTQGESPEEVRAMYRILLVAGGIESRAKMTYSLLEPRVSIHTKLATGPFRRPYPDLRSFR